jgi:hypothetical protein
MLNRLLKILLIVIIIPCAKAHAQEKDSIFLYNGQILIGDIQGGQLGEITIDDKDLKDLQVKLYKIKRLKTIHRFKIQLFTKKIYYGIIKESGKEGWVNILLDNKDTLQTAITAISFIITLKKGFFKQLDGTLSAGFSYSKSSDVGQLTLGSTILYASKLFEYQLSTSAIESIDSSTLSRDREDAQLFVAFSLTPSWFAAVNLNYQRNLELSIARRWQEMIGGGNRIFLKKDWQLLAISGLTFNQEKSTSGTSSSLLLEIPVMLKFDFFKYHHPNIQVNSTQSVFFSLSQKNRVRYDGNTTFSWELIRYFYLSINLYANSDNQPPQGNSNFDYGTAVSISYKF